MKGLKIIPFFLFMIVLSYVGMLFVQANPGEVVVVFFGDLETPPLAMGFVVLTSALIGMIGAGFLCLLELVVLYLQNKSLKRKLDAALEEKKPKEDQIPTEKMALPKPEAKLPKDPFGTHSPSNGGAASSKNKVSEADVKKSKTTKSQPETKA